MGKNKEMIDYPNYNKTYKANPYVHELVDYLKKRYTYTMKRKDYLKLLRERLETLPMEYQIGVWRDNEK